MKTKLLILSLLLCLNSFGQKLPITPLCWADVHTYFSVNCNGDAFAAANSSYFDATYAKAGGNWLSEFRNYGPATCTRPGGLTDFYFFDSISGVAVTVDNVCYVTWTGISTGYAGETLGGEGDDVYKIFGGTDCIKVIDGYYIMGNTSYTSFWSVQISGGKLYYVPC